MTEAVELIQGLLEFGKKAEELHVTEIRNCTHGSFMDNARISQAIKNLIRDEDGWKHCSDDQREALEMIALKISRICSGKANFKDHWLDIQGYAKLGEDACTNSS